MSYTLSVGIVGKHRDKEGSTSPFREPGLLLASAGRSYVDSLGPALLRSHVERSGQDKVVRLVSSHDQRELPMMSSK